MREGGERPPLYWRVDDDGVLHVFDHAFVKRGDAAICGINFIGSDGSAFARDLDAVRAAGRLVRVHGYCMAASIALLG